MSKSFTTPSKPIDFDIDGDPFQTNPAVAAGLMLDLAGLKGRESVERFLEAILEDGGSTETEERVRYYDVEVDGKTVTREETYEAVIPVEGSSLDRFQKRLRSKTRPIATDTLNEVMKYLIEETTGRPFELPSGSPDGSSATPPSSTPSASTPG